MESSLQLLSVAGCPGSRPNSGRLPGYRCRRFNQQSSSRGNDDTLPVVHRSPYRPFSIGSADAIRTTPWMACDPKCVVAGPPKTSVMLELGIEYGISSPPVTQTCSDDEGGLVSKGALLPFPVNRLTVSSN